MKTEYTLIQQFETLLKNHDWYYDFTDDNSVWRRGQAEWNAIMKVKEELLRNGYSYDKIQGMIKEYSEKLL